MTFRPRRRELHQRVGDVSGGFIGEGDFVLQQNRAGIPPYALPPFPSPKDLDMRRISGEAIGGFSIAYGPRSPSVKASI